MVYGEEVHKKKYKGTFDIFFGIEHKMRKEETWEQFNKEAMQGWRFAADGARITDEKACSENRKHTSGGVFVAIDSNRRAVIGKEQEQSRGSQEMKEELSPVTAVVKNQEYERVGRLLIKTTQVGHLLGRKK